MISQLFYPELTFLYDLGEDGKLILRILASYCYYNQVFTYCLTIGINFCLVLCFSIYFLIKNTKDGKTYFSTLISLFVLLTFIFYVISSPHSNSNRRVPLVIPDLYWLWSFIHIFILLVCFLLYQMIQKAISKPKNQPDLIEITRFVCPLCNHVFEANILYCPYCEQYITTQIQNKHG